MGHFLSARFRLACVSTGRSRAIVCAEHRRGYYRPMREVYLDLHYSCARPFLLYMFLTVFRTI